MKKPLKASKKMSHDEQEDVDFDTGEREEDVYEEKSLDKLRDDDEISPIEEGFMEGELHGGTFGKCAKCGKILQDEESVIEEDIRGMTYRFCSDICANKFEVKKSKRK